MSNQISRFDPKASLSRPSSSANKPGRSQKGAEDISWKVLQTDDDLFADFLKGGLPGPRLSWSGGEEKGVVRRVDGRAVQEKTIWTATDTGFDIWVLRRTMTRKADGRYAPSTKWAVHEHQQHLFGADRSKRSGSVPSKVTQSTVSVTDTGPGQKVGKEMANGMDAMSYLPAEVQTGILGIVPAPAILSGHLHQRLRGDTPVGLELNLLAFDGTRAVVVAAQKQAEGKWQNIDSLPWKVTQVHGSVTEPRPTLAGKTRLAIGAGK